MTAPSLRAGVSVKVASGEISIIDEHTGLRLTLDPNEVGEADQLLSDESVVDALGELGLLEQGLPEEEIVRRQRPHGESARAQARLSALNGLIALATTRVPYYRTRPELYSPRPLQQESELQRFPVLTKSVVREQFPDGLVVEGVDIAGMLNRRQLAVATTSGTTGDRLQVVADLAMSGLPSAVDRFLGVPAKGDYETRVAVFTTPTCLGTECHLGKMSYEERLRGPRTLFLNSPFDLFSLKRELVEQNIEELRRFQPEFLLVNPTYLHWFLRRAAEWSLDVPKPLAVLTSYEFASALSKRAIAQQLGVPVFNYYAASDLGGCRVGMECRYGHLHVREDQAHVELIRGQRQAEPGELGRVVVSTVGARVMPLLRYAVGDVGCWSAAECHCAHWQWRVLELHGRSKDLLFLDGQHVSTRMVDQVLSQQPGIELYRCNQVGDSALELQVVPSLGSEVHRGELAARVSEAFRCQQVQVKVVKRLDPEPSLKFRLTEAQISAPELT